MKQKDGGAKSSAIFAIREKVRKEKRYGNDYIQRSDTVPEPVR